MTHSEFITMAREVEMAADHRGLTHTAAAMRQVILDMVSQNDWAAASIYGNPEKARETQLH